MGDTGWRVFLAAILKHTESVVRGRSSQSDRDQVKEPFGAIQIDAVSRMLSNQGNLWVSLGTATKLIDVSDDTIERRAMEWRPEPETHRIRYKLLVLGEYTRANRRYYLPDVIGLLQDPRLHRRGRPRKITPLRQQPSLVAQPAPELH